MNLNDKKAWLGRQGGISRYTINSGTTRTLYWRTNGGRQFIAEGDTAEQIWGNLYKDVKETLFMVINDTSYHQWKYR